MTFWTNKIDISFTKAELDILFPEEKILRKEHALHEFIRELTNLKYKYRGGLSQECPSTLLMGLYIYQRLSDENYIKLKDIVEYEHIYNLQIQE